MDVMANKKIILIFLAIILLTSLISAFGVSSPYWETNPLRMARGESKVVNLNLQNMVGSEDVSVRAIIIEGQEIAKIRDEVYEVKFGTYDTMAPLEIKIPKEALPGETKRVKVEFTTAVPNDLGVVALGTGMTISFDVIVTDEIAKTKTPWMLIGIISGIIILIIILIVVIRKKIKE